MLPDEIDGDTTYFGGGAGAVKHWGLKLTECGKDEIPDNRFGELPSGVTANRWPGFMGAIYVFVSPDEKKAIAYWEYT